jgi:hypothetical protein
MTPVDGCVPDCRVAESYRPHLDLSGDGWAWEFLRRNPDFRAAQAANAASPEVASEEAGPWGLLAFPFPRS